MSELNKKRGLGRGFDSLIPVQIVEAEFDVTAEPSDASALREVSVDLIDPNPDQPRKSFEAGQLEELASSIKHHGVIQPLVVTQKNKRYQLVAGERRLRASKLANLKTVPVIIRSFSQQNILEIAIIENLQREDLNPIEKATAYRKLMDQFNLNHKEIGRRVGKDRTTIVNTIRLLNLPIEVKRMVTDGLLTENQARSLLALPEQDKQIELARLAVKRGWTVRQIEEYARAFGGRSGSKEKAEERISLTNDYTYALSEQLGTKVTQAATAKGGKIIIEYYSDEELARIYGALIKDQEA
jgi:ParB family transcriptional regulator, chromosome partitioning protein